MNGTNLLEGRSGPVTQSIDAVKSLLAWKGHPTNPMPADVSLDNGRLVLVLSNKKDAYYTCTARACSCPGNQFRHNCKHMRKYFPQQETAKPVSANESLRPAGKWDGGFNGPVDPSEIEAEA
jgi:hypothetical protein